MLILIRRRECDLYFLERGTQESGPRRRLPRFPAGFLRGKVKNNLIGLSYDVNVKREGIFEKAFRLYVKFCTPFFMASPPPIPKKESLSSLITVVVHHPI